MSPLRRVDLWRVYAPLAQDGPPRFSADERRALLLLHCRYRATRDQFSRAELRRLNWWAWALSTGRIGRG